MTDSSPTLEQRLRSALTAAAEHLHATPPRCSGIERRSWRRNRGVVAAVAAALSVVIVAVAIAAVLSWDRTPSGQTPASRQPQELAPSNLVQLEADIVVYMKVPADQTQLAVVRRVIRGSANVRSFAFVDQAAAYREFKQAFHDQPDLVNSVDQQALPVGFRIIVRRCDTRPALITLLSQHDGVDEVTAGQGLSHAAAKRLGNRRALPPTLPNGHCTYRQPKGAPVATITVTALPSLSYPDTQFTVPAGIIEIHLANAGGTHTLAFDDPQYQGFELAVPQGAATGRVKLKPGSYTIYCTTPGHRQAGEEATITVT
jgi:hypothetical protein